MEEFFSHYASFDYSPSAPYYDEFRRLEQHEGWSDKSHARRKALRKFRAAMIQEFNNRFGTDHKDLSAWQNLCVVLGVEPVPDSITQCRKKIKRLHINLVDLVQARDGTQIRRFRTLTELQEYTVQNGKVFPKNKAKAGGLLKHLLREMQL